MKKFFLAAAVLTLGFASCKKDGTTPNPTPDPLNPPAGTKLLKKVTKTEGNKTIIYNLTYDGNKRLTSMESTDGQEYVKFTYDGNGNVTGSEELNEQFKNQFTYTYQNGVPKAGTFKSWQREAGSPDELHEDDVMTYTVENNAVTKISLQMKQINQTTDFHISYKNGNVNVIETKNSPFRYYAQFDFGTKKSALPAVYKYVMDHAGYSAQFMGKNDLAAYLYDFGGTVPGFGKQNQYTYDAAGYPLTSNDGTATFKYEYQ